MNTALKNQFAKATLLGACKILARQNSGRVRVADVRDALAAAGRSAALKDIYTAVYVSPRFYLSGKGVFKLVPYVRISPKGRRRERHDGQYFAA
jgi:hypothetical protein